MRVPIGTSGSDCEKSGTSQTCIAPFKKILEPRRRAAFILEKYGTMQTCIAPFGKNMEPRRRATFILETDGAMQTCIAPFEKNMSTATLQAARCFTNGFPHH